MDYMELYLKEKERWKQEKKRRKQEKKRRQQADERLQHEQHENQNTTFEEFIEFSSNKYSTLSTGSYSLRARLQRLLPSRRFLRDHGDSVCRKALASEADLVIYENNAVQDQVYQAITALRSIPAAQEAFHLGTKIDFENTSHAIDKSASSPNKPIVDETMKPKRSNADQDCVHHVENRDNILLYTIEYKPAHKLSADHLRHGLREMLSLISPSLRPGVAYFFRHHLLNDGSDEEAGPEDRTVKKTRLNPPLEGSEPLTSNDLAIQLIQDSDTPADARSGDSAQEQVLSIVEISETSRLSDRSSTPQVRSHNPSLWSYFNVSSLPGKLWYPKRGKKEPVEDREIQYKV
ncbi:hypothetical protein V1517DRAFT_349205 [Lipomyces orientalis]|uniref:Uncharacterized protein n=1 Tax=Lipomyces orientalis TaxID=1233043 RepID=A0ACC3TDS3_9ASCO